jgi:hypothetical protein
MCRFMKGDGDDDRDDPDRRQIDPVRLLNHSIAKSDCQPWKTCYGATR